MFPLEMLKVGDKAVIEELFLRGNLDRKYAARLECMGFRSGASVSVLTNEGRGPVVVMIGNSRIALARGIAKKIMVKKVEVIG